jgi:hypothetical protein
MICASALYVLLYRENKKRCHVDANEGEKDRLAFKDLTDKENKYFRYAL